LEFFHLKDFYTSFYARAEHSPAHHCFCESVFGMDLCQHGFADMHQLDLLMQVLQLSAGKKVLDVGCGTGMITEYLSDQTNAQITGLDFISEATDQARQRTAAKADRLKFLTGDINDLQLEANDYDAILSIDSIYFSNDYAGTVRSLITARKPGGQLAFLYSHGREPWIPVDQFDAETIQPDKTPLAEALLVNNLCYRTWNLTQQDYALAQRRKAVLLDLKPVFEKEGNLFIYENRMGDAEGIMQAIEVGLHARYLYVAY
jgi:cyclopropane fatty-acyl-phospholipid synthase-like methyltransferase